MKHMAMEESVTVVRKENTVKVFIIEEQELYREMLQKVLQATSFVDVAGVFPSSQYQLLSGEINRSKPDVLLIGIKKISAALQQELETIKEKYPKMGIIILVNEPKSVDVERLRPIVMRGSSGLALFMKLSVGSLEQLCMTIRAVHEGQVILDPELASSLFHGKTDNGFLKQLTARELEILSLLSQGYTNGAIAAALFIDIKTVEHHLNSLYGKLKTDPEFSSKHLRVSAARQFYEHAGGLREINKSAVMAGVKKY